MHAEEYHSTPLRKAITQFVLLLPNNYISSLRNRNIIQLDNHKLLQFYATEAN